MKAIYKGLTLGFAAAVFAAGTAQGAVDVVVNSTQPEVAGSSYQTINGALAYAKTQTEPRVVRITGGGPYLENLSINFSVTVKGDNYKPVVVAKKLTGQPNAGLNDNAVAFYTSSEFPGNQSFRLENITILPDPTDAPLRAIRSNNNGAGLSADRMTVDLDRVLITANNGSNAPVSTDGLSKANLTGATIFRDDPTYFSGFVNVNILNTVITNCYGNAANADGIIWIPDDATGKLTIGPGTVISYINRLAIQVATTGAAVDIIGTPENPVIIKGNYGNWTTKNPAIAFFNNGGTTPITANLKYVVFMENNAASLGSALATTTGPGLVGDHLAFVNNKDTAISIGSRNSNPWTFTNVTVVNSPEVGATASPAVLISEPAAGTVTGAISFTDSIIAGNGTAGTAAGANMVRINTTAAPITFTNSAVVTAGPYALDAAKYSLNTGALAPVENGVISADPQFKLVGSNFSSPDFLDVQAAAYATAGTGNQPLHGYGDYIASSVSDWSVY